MMQATAQHASEHLQCKDAMDMHCIKGFNAKTVT